MNFSSLKKHKAPFREPFPWPGGSGSRSSAGPCWPPITRSLGNSRGSQLPAHAALCRCQPWQGHSAAVTVACVSPRLGHRGTQPAHISWLSLTRGARTGLSLPSRAGNGIGTRPRGAAPGLGHSHCHCEQGLSPRPACGGVRAGIPKKPPRAACCGVRAWIPLP